MPLPLIPIFALANIVGGTYLLTWYFHLDPRKRIEADEEANKLAMRWFNKRLNQLDRAEAKELLNQVEQEHKG